jgi:hypothetical protein
VIISCRWWSCRPSRDPPADESPDTTQHNTTQTATTAAVSDTDTASDLLMTSPSPLPVASPSPVVGGGTSSSGSPGGALPAPECPHQLNGSTVVIRINAGVLKYPALDLNPAGCMPRTVAALVQHVTVQVWHAGCMLTGRSTSLMNNADLATIFMTGMNSLMLPRHSQILCYLVLQSIPRWSCSG